MDANTATVLVVALVVVIAIVFLFIFRGRGKVKMRGPFKTELDLDGSNDPKPGVHGENLTSEEGGLTAHDKSGRGVEVKGAHTKKDIDLTTEAPPGDKNPKG